MGKIIDNPVNRTVLKYDPAAWLEKQIGFYGPNRAMQDTSQGKGDLVSNYMSIFSGGPPKDPEKDPLPLTQEVGDEGVRRGALNRAARKKEISQLYLTRGSRSNDSTLGGYLQNLGG